MDFSVEYSLEATLQLGRVGRIAAKRIILKVASARGNPDRFFKRLSGRPEHKLRVGDYRVIAMIDTKGKKIFVRTIGHRKDTYAKH